MLNEFLKVAYAQELKKQDQSELTELLSHFPARELSKLASGMPVSQVYAKTASHDDPLDFLDKFKGTPFYEQALALEQEELQADMLEQQKREEREMDANVYNMRDKIRLKKRMLELELAKSEQAAPPGEPMQGSGAPGPVPAEGVQDSSQGLGGGVAKMSSSANSYEQKIAFADNLGRQLARRDFEKAAHAQALNEYGALAGAVMAKEALNLGALGGLAQKALANPRATGALIGGGLGAIGGAMTASRDPQTGETHRLRNALVGAGLGAGAGAAAGHVGGQMQKGIQKNMAATGGDVRAASRMYGQQLRNQSLNALGLNRPAGTGMGAVGHAQAPASVAAAAAPASVSAAAPLNPALNQRVNIPPSH